MSPRALYGAGGEDGPRESVAGAWVASTPSPMVAASRSRGDEVVYAAPVPWKTTWEGGVRAPASGWMKLPDDGFRWSAGHTVKRGVGTKTPQVNSSSRSAVGACCDRVLAVA